MKTAALLMLLLSATAAIADGGSFHETFDSIDSQRWYVSDGWTNGPHQNCTWSREAVSVADGRLQLSFLPGDVANPRHRCGEVQTHATFHHGTYEARVRSARGSGLNAAFFTYIGPVHGQPHDEIDVEILTRDTTAVDLNTYVDGAPQNHARVPVFPATDAGFQTYAFTWTADGITWFIDGRQVHRATTPLPVTPQKIYLSHWGTETLTDWMGPFVLPAGPVVMEIDWVAFTPLGLTCQFPQSVLCTAP